MDLRHFFSTTAVIILMTQVIWIDSTSETNAKQLIYQVPARTPITVPLYVSQPVDVSSAGYPYYFYPQSQYPNTGVVYHPTNTVGQYPFYVWPNTPVQKPANIPVTPNSPAAHIPPSRDNVGDPNNPKNDVEYIY